MKAEELMVGDWVYAIDEDHKKHPCRIATLEYDSTNKRDDFSIDFYGTDYEVEWPDVAFEVKPIPLTAEILEKNGFKKLGFDGWEFDYETEGGCLIYEVLWRCDYPKEYHTHLTIESYSPDFGSFKSFRIDSVHELQHALRLCKINKTIEL